MMRLGQVVVATGAGRGGRSGRADSSASQSGTMGWPDSEGVR
jgi:hypothetical protein